MKNSILVFAGLLMFTWLFLLYFTEGTGYYLLPIAATVLIAIRLVFNKLLSKF
jgi:hypothetical protein